jgi:hypothetical protein
MMDETFVICGLLSLHSYGEADDILFVSSERGPLAEVLHERIARKRVSARYWITEKLCTLDEAQEDFVRRLFGGADTRFGSHYSEITGYLWTDEKVKIGGHDLIEELRNNVGKWLILEVVIHRDPVRE